MRSSRQRRLSEANGVFDPTGAQPGVVTPQPPPAPKAPVTPQEPAVPKVPAPKAPPPGDSDQKVTSLISAGDILLDASAKLETATAFVRKADSGVAEELDKVRSALMSCSGGIRERLIDMAQKDPSVADEVRVWLMQGAAQPSAAQAAPVPPPTPFGMQQQPMESFPMKLSKLFEDGVTKERTKTSQECDKVIQVSQHQGPKKGNPPKTHGKSPADFAAKDVTGNAYGSPSGGFG